MGIFKSALPLSPIRIVVLFIRSCHFAKEVLLPSTHITMDRIASAVLVVLVVMTLALAAFVRGLKYIFIFIF